jgi:Glycosyl hydrolase catalytic core
MRIFIRRARIATVVLMMGLAGWQNCPAQTTPLSWGVVGHNDRPDSGNSDPYNKIPLQQQFRLLNELGADWYRTSCTPANCAAVIAAAKAAHVNILESMLYSPDRSADEAANYAYAFAHAAGIAKLLGSSVTFYEAGNELDTWVGMTGDGSERSQYNAQKYLQARGVIRGLIDGIHSVNPSAKALVDDAGWCHYGFLQMLWADGVRWDITGLHWYANEGNIEQAGCKKANVAELHAAFGKPVWITEFNFKPQQITDDPAAAWILSFTRQIQRVASKYNIQTAFAYELFDEPDLSVMEDRFGLRNSDGSVKAQYQAFAAVIARPIAPSNISIK